MMSSALTASCNVPVFIPVLIPLFIPLFSPVFIPIVILVACTGHREDRRDLEYFSGVCSWRLNRISPGQVWYVTGLQILRLTWHGSAPLYITA